MRGEATCSPTASTPFRIACKLPERYKPIAFLGGLMNLVPLSDDDGSWSDLKTAWRAQCDEFGEDFSAYAQGVFSVLDPLAADGHPRAGIFSLKEPSGYIAFCQINRTPLPGYDGPVLRVRFITLAPEYDFGDLPLEAYSKVLVGLFYDVVKLSISDDMRARHIKFHLASPADRQFFAAIGSHLNEEGLFETVRVQGGWLYVTKNG